MRIIDLTTDHESLYFCCLEDWSDEMKEAGDHKACWYQKLQNKGLRVKLALDDNDQVGGMIQYAPCEFAPIQGTDLYFIFCIWVHGHKEGRGSFQKKGMGKALLQAAEDDVRTLGSAGLVAWGLAFPIWMKASWFKKQGYKKIDKNRGRVLLWKKFKEAAQPPQWVVQRRKPEKVSGKVTVTALKNGWCSVQNAVFERARRACDEFGDEVEFIPVATAEREILLDWGISDALFVNRRNIAHGPPLSYKKIKKRIVREVKKLSKKGSKICE